MKCVISNPNIKRFGRVFTALGKLGDVVYVDATSSCFLLHAVNSSRSAYGSFKFLPEFFQTYSFDKQVNCKLSIKSFFMVFKSLISLDKNTEQCIIEFPDDTDALVVKHLCKHNIMKVYNLPFIECETLRTSFQIDEDGNFLCAESKLFSDSVQNFQPSVEEVTLKISDEKVSMKNYTEDEKDPLSVVHTEVTYEIEEFFGHKFESDCEITFCLKEFKAILSFIEGLCLTLKVMFTEPGHPIAFKVENTADLHMEIKFIMATLAEQNANESQSQQTVSQSRTNSVVSPASINASRNLSTAPRDIVPSAVSTIDLTVNEDANGAPLAPPKKRLRSEFLGLSSDSDFTSMIVQPDPILVRGSDDEED